MLTQRRKFVHEQANPEFFAHHAAHCTFAILYFFFPQTISMRSNQSGGEAVLFIVGAILFLPLALLRRPEVANVP